MDQTLSTDDEHPPAQEALKGEELYQTSRFQRKERLTPTDSQLTDSAIYSIRIQSLPKGQESGKPKNTRRGWVPLKIEKNNKGDKDAQPVYVWANVNSIAKHTGLSKKVIGDAAKRGELEALLKKRFQETAGVEKAVKGAGFYVKVAKLPEGGKSDPQVSIRRADGTAQQASRVGLARAFGLSEAAVQEASNKGRLALLPDNQVGLKPLPKALKDMVLKVQRLRDEIRPPGTGNPPAALAGRVSRLDRKQLKVFISQKGAVYIVNMSKRLGEGGFKDVIAGVSEQGETVAVGVTKRGATAGDRREQDWYRQFRGVRGMAQFHVGFALKQSVIGRFFDDAQIVTIGHRYQSDLFSMVESIRNQRDKAQRLRNRAFICNNLLAGLAHAHTKGILLRDVKPENILLNYSGSEVTDAVHCDFGATIEEKETETVEAEGTLEYLSPLRRASYREAGRCPAAQQADDRWALGTTLLWVLTGKNPAWCTFGQGFDASEEQCKVDFTKEWPDSSSDPKAMQELRALCYDLLFDKEKSTQELAKRAETIFEGLPKPPARSESDPKR